MESLLKWKLLAAVLLAVIVILLYVYQSNQFTFAYESLQGCRHIDGNGTYIVFDDTSMQVLELLSDGGFKVLYEDTDIKCKFLFDLSLKTHRYRITRSKSSTFNHPMFKNANVEIKLYPVIGCMSVVEDGKEVSRLATDTEMSVEYLS